MSDYLERLERELLSAAHRYRSDAAARPARTHRRTPRLAGAVPVLLSVGATVAVIGVAVGTGVVGGGSSNSPSHPRHAQPTGVVQPRVSTSPACAERRGHPGLPPLVQSNASPGSGLGSMLSIARQPAAENELAALGSYDRFPVGVITVFKRFIRIVDGDRGTRVAFFPAVVCNGTDIGTVGHLPQRVRIAPVLAMVMVVLSSPPPRTAVLVGTAATIRNGPALPGIDLPNHEGWIQATVVPDGVARVVMDFTPPFLHHYTATATIHDNIGIVVRNPDYTPTIVKWYGTDGHLIRTFIDRSALRFDRCLAQHRPHC